MTKMGCLAVPSLGLHSNGSLAVRAGQVRFSLSDCLGGCYLASVTERDFHLSGFFLVVFRLSGFVSSAAITVCLKSNGIFSFVFLALLIRFFQSI